MDDGVDENTEFNLSDRDMAELPWQVRLSRILGKGDIWAREGWSRVYDGGVWRTVDGGRTWTKV